MEKERLRRFLTKIFSPGSFAEYYSSLSNCIKSGCSQLEDCTESRLDIPGKGFIIFSCFFKTVGEKPIS